MRDSAIFDKKVIFVASGFFVVFFYSVLFFYSGVLDEDVFFVVVEVFNAFLSLHTIRKLKTENHTVETSKYFFPALQETLTRRDRLPFCTWHSNWKNSPDIILQNSPNHIDADKKATLYSASLAVMEYYTLMVDQHDRPVGYQTENTVVMAY